MKWHSICHAKNFSPNLARPLKGKITVDLYKKIYKQYKQYEDFQQNPLNVYSAFLHTAIKQFHQYKKLNSILEDLKNQIPYPQTYGLKLDQEKTLRLELYFYYNKRINFEPSVIVKEYEIFLNILKAHGADINQLVTLLDEEPFSPSTIWSFNFFNDNKFFDNQINIYIENRIKENDIVYWGNQYTKDLNGKSKEGLFLCFHADYSLNLRTDLNYNFTEFQLNCAEQIIKKYKCKEYNISNKTEANGESIFFVQYFGISDTDYEQFLISNNYPQSIILDYQKNKNFYESLSKEITEVYKITDTDFVLTRSGTYGLI